MTFSKMTFKRKTIIRIPLRKMTFKRKTMITMTFSKMTLNRNTIIRVPLSKMTFKRKTILRMTYSKMMLNRKTMIRMTFSKMTAFSANLYRAVAFEKKVNWLGHSGNCHSDECLPAEWRVCKLPLVSMKLNIEKTKENWIIDL